MHGNQKDCIALSVEFLCLFDIKAENGISVGEAVLRRKIAHAKSLLDAGVPAHRASEMVGFNHYSAFFRIFKRITGHAPTGAR